MPEGTTIARLVDQFVATLQQHGIAIDRATAAQEIQDRIADIAERLQVDQETVLRDHAGDSWGRTMAAGVTDQVRGDRLLDAAGSPAERPEVRRLAHGTH